VGEKWKKSWEKLPTRKNKADNRGSRSQKKKGILKKKNIWFASHKGRKGKKTGAEGTSWGDKKKKKRIFSSTQMNKKKTGGHKTQQGGTGGGPEDRKKPWNVRKGNEHLRPR